METYIHLYNRSHGVIFQGPPVVSYASFGKEANRASQILFKLAVISGIFGALFISAYFLPKLMAGYSDRIAETAQTSANEKPTIVREEKPAYEPKFDPKLSKESGIKIPAIGVDAPITEATIDNYESALKKGAWRVSDFGTPSDRGEPTILAGHRFGYLSWNNLFRRKNSFYNLPKLKIGDTIEVNWHQRKYIYEVYWEDKGEKILDYSADLILYTCESLNSPVRIVKYARLLEI